MSWNHDTFGNFMSRIQHEGEVLLQNREYLPDGDEHEDREKGMEGWNAVLKPYCMEIMSNELRRSRTLHLLDCSNGIKGRKFVSDVPYGTDSRGGKKDWASRKEGPRQCRRRYSRPMQCPQISQSRHELEGP